MKVQRKESRALWMWAVWLRLWLQREGGFPSGFDLLQIAQNGLLDTFFREIRISAFRTHEMFLPAQPKSKAFAVMDLIAPMLHEHKEVSEIVGVLDGIVQVRFEHRAEPSAGSFSDAATPHS